MAPRYCEHLIEIFTRVRLEVHAHTAVLAIHSRTGLFVAKFIIYGTLRLSFQKYLSGIEVYMYIESDLL
jgi:hypothetical protein